MHGNNEQVYAGVNYNMRARVNYEQVHAGVNYEHACTCGL